MFGGHVLHVSYEIEDYEIQIDEEFIINGLSETSSEPGDTHFVNHSCDPNAGIKGQIFLMALRDIDVDEQGTFDYAMCLHESPSAPRYRMTCRCGSVRCRKIVTDDDWRLPDLWKRCDGYFSLYLQEKIDQLKEELRRDGEPRE